MSKQKELYERISRGYEVTAEDMPLLREMFIDMHSALYSVLDELDGKIDVVDGDYGEPSPNWAMRLTTEIEEALGESKGY